MIIDQFAQALQSFPTEGLIIYEDDFNGTITHKLVNQYRFEQQNLVVASMSTRINLTFPGVAVHNVPISRILNVRRSRPIRGIFLRYDCTLAGNEDTSPQNDIELIRTHVKTTCIVAIDQILKYANRVGHAVNTMVKMFNKDNMLDVQTLDHETKRYQVASQIRLFRILKLERCSAPLSRPIQKRTNKERLEPAVELARPIQKRTNKERLELLEKRVNELLEVVQKYT